MRCKYKGFDIEVKKEKCLAGYDLTYYSIFRESDGWELASGFYDTEDIVRSIIEDVKNYIVNDYILHPEDYED